MKDSDKKDIWLVVVNVFAASRKAGSVWKKAAAMLEEANVPYKAMFTGGPDNAIAISRKSCARGYRRFIAVGGDGTVHDVLNGIAYDSASKRIFVTGSLLMCILPKTKGFLFPIFISECCLSVQEMTGSSLLAYPRMSKVLWM